MIKVGIFDVGGVLLQGSGKSMRKSILEDFQIAEETFNDAYYSLSDDHMKGLITEEEFWSNFYKKTGMKGNPPAISIFAKHGGTLARNDDLFEIIRQLKLKGLKVAILSNVINAFTHESKKKGGIYEEFHEVILSCEVGMSKPDPEIYKHTLRKLGVQPSEAFFIDDMKDNVLAAKNIGMHAFQYKDMKTLVKNLKGLGVM